MIKPVSLVATWRLGQGRLCVRRGAGSYSKKKIFVREDGYLSDAIGKMA